MPGTQKRPAKQSKQEPNKSNRHSSRQESPVSAERLKRLYSAMLQCRVMHDLVQKKAARPARNRGMEAIIAGTVIHLKSTDLIAPSQYRAFARAIQGAPWKDVLDEFKHESQWGRENAASDRFHLAAGMAFACKTMKQDSVVLCLATVEREPHFWREALGFSAEHQLPLVLVLAHSANENKVGALRSKAQTLAPAITVDGSDAVAVSRVAEESTRRARQGLGSSVIECFFERERDPLIFMEDYLKQRSLWSESWKQALVRKFTQNMTAVK
jgi:TPP-dependent pyruvate/acetoin dehydrogenase alpha subunit